MPAIRPLLALALLAISSQAWAHDYPSKAGKIVVPFTAGSATDILARVVGEQLTPVGDSRAQFTAFVKSEIAKWSKVAKDSGVTAD